MSWAAIAKFFTYLWQAITFAKSVKEQMDAVTPTPAKKEPTVIVRTEQMFGGFRDSNLQQIDDYRFKELQEAVAEEARVRDLHRLPNDGERNELKELDQEIAALLAIRPEVPTTECRLNFTLHGTLVAPAPEDDGLEEAERQLRWRYGFWSEDTSVQLKVEELEYPHSLTPEQEEFLTKQLIESLEQERFYAGYGTLRDIFAEDRGAWIDWNAKCRDLKKRVETKLTELQLEKIRPFGES
jgi:hypothetical protein